MLRHYLLTAASLLILPGLVRANTDPSIGILGGDPTCDQTIDVNVTSINPTVQPKGIAGTTCFIITNNSGATINGLDFDMTINSGLVDAGLNVTGSGGIFSISQLDPSGYFLHTSLTYTNSSGDLNFDFFGVKKADGDESCGFPGSPSDCEINEQEGIPKGGIFTLELTGWVNSLTVSDPINVYLGLPDVTSSFTTVPEPSSSIAVVIVFWLSLA